MQLGGIESYGGVALTQARGLDDQRWCGIEVSWSSLVCRANYASVKPVLDSGGLIEATMAQILGQTNPDSTIQKTQSSPPKRCEADLRKVSGS